MELKITIPFKQCSLRNGEEIHLTISSGALLNLIDNILMEDGLNVTEITDVLIKKINTYNGEGLLKNFPEEELGKIIHRYSVVKNRS